MARIGIDGLYLRPRTRCVPPVVPEHLDLRTGGRPGLEDRPAGVVSPVAVDEQEAPEALGLERAEHLPEHGAVRLGRERRAAGVGGEVRRDPVRQRRQHRHAERLRRLDRHPLGEDLVDREREVAVLLDGPERQHDPVVRRAGTPRAASSCSPGFSSGRFSRTQPPPRAAARPRRQRPRAAGPQAGCLPRCRTEPRRPERRPGCRDR